MTQTLQIRVTGMTCGGCENAVKRAVGQLEGVDEVQASHQQATVTVTADLAKVTRDAIEQRIEKLGYTVARQP
jgi:copper chaperone